MLGRTRSQRKKINILDFRGRHTYFRSDSFRGHHTYFGSDWDELTLSGTFASGIGGYGVGGY